MISKNGVGLVVLLASLIGVQVTDIQVIDVLSAIGQVVSFTLLIWNQLGRSDVNNFVFKK